MSLMNLNMKLNKYASLTIYFLLAVINAISYNPVNNILWDGIIYKEDIEYCINKSLTYNK